MDINREIRPDLRIAEGKAENGQKRKLVTHQQPKDEKTEVDDQKNGKSESHT